jgi:putative addiction module CopG family antidote
LSKFELLLPFVAVGEKLGSMATEQMNISMPPQMARFIRGKVKAGAYTNVSEAIRDAIRRMQEAEAAKQDQALLANFEVSLPEGGRAGIRRGVRQGIKDIGEGQYEEYTPDGLKDLAKELVSSSVKRVARSKAT